MKRATRPSVSPKTSRLSESVIREMTRLADKHGALNLAQGFPDFPAPASIKAAAVRAIEGDYNQYAVTWGSPNLRRAVCEKAEWFNGIHADPDKNITVTCGSTEAMMATVMALADAGDEVIMFEPAYENYAPSAILAGATPKPVPLGEGFDLDEESLKKAFTPHTKLVIVNTPHNPSGKVLGRADLKVIADLCEDSGAVAVTDEIYEHILYDGREHVSLATLGDMADRTVTISGISKTYTATGWRVAYTIAEPGMTNAIRKVHDYMTLCAPAPLQEAAAFALRLPRSFYADLAESYQKKRDFIAKGLREIGFEFFMPEGSYYILADFGRLSSLPDTKFATSMTVDCGVAVVPGSSFYADGRRGRTQVRFSYSKKDATLKKAVSRMNRYFS
ncbi:MAG: aminotransferase class I/II-fold pyridoxal phosphate-dependent enzyme [Thaumarchaeota archaeon]|nr:aminotransferase class I/II-fold pyridoxal phosphate-dependent enzyme [Nitrososphaerota archaeon]